MHSFKSSLSIKTTERHLVPTETGNVFTDVGSCLFQRSSSMILRGTEDCIFNTVSDKRVKNYNKQQNSRKTDKYGIVNDNYLACFLFPYTSGGTIA